MNLLAVQKMQEIQVQSLGGEDPLEEEMAAHSSILPSAPALPCRAKSLQSRLTLGDPVDCSPPDFSVGGIIQARILEWVDIPSPRGLSQPRDQTQVSCIAGRLFTI